MATINKKNEKSSVQHNVDGNILADYTVHKRIGKGAYGIVYKASDKTTKHFVAIKKIFDAFRNKTDAQRTYREILFLKSFKKHPNIITMIDMYKASNNKDLYVIFEYMENDLNKVIREKVLKDVHIRYIMFQLCNGLEYIHACRVMHRDLKPSNILINKTCTIKIGDMGLARSLVEGDGCLTEYIATRWYRAPEILVSNRKYTQYVDIWSLGCILAEMLLGKPIFPGGTTSHQLQLIVDMIKNNPPHSAKFYNFFKGKPIESIDLVEKILVLNPVDRLGPRYIRDHIYISNYFPNETHSIPQVSPHTIVLDLDDNTQREIIDYQKKLYDVVKCVKSSRSSIPPIKKDKRTERHQLNPVTESSKNQYSSNSKLSEKENNPSNVNASTKSKVPPSPATKCNKDAITKLKDLNSENSNHPISASQANGSDNYVTYNKHNIAIFEHKSKRRLSNHSSSNTNYDVTEDTAILVTSKTYQIDKDHVKHVDRKLPPPKSHYKTEYAALNSATQPKYQAKERELPGCNNYPQINNIQPRQLNKLNPSSNQSDVKNHITKSNECVKELKKSMDHIIQLSPCITQHGRRSFQPDLTSKEPVEENKTIKPRNETLKKQSNINLSNNNLCSSHQTKRNNDLEVVATGFCDRTPIRSPYLETPQIKNRTEVQKLSVDQNNNKTLGLLPPHPSVRNKVRDTISSQNALNRKYGIKFEVPTERPDLSYQNKSAKNQPEIVNKNSLNMGTSHTRPNENPSTKRFSYQECKFRCSHCNHIEKVLINKNLYQSHSTICNGDNHILNQCTEFEKEPFSIYRSQQEIYKKNSRLQEEESLRFQEGIDNSYRDYNDTMRQACDNDEKNYWLFNEDTVHDNELSNSPCVFDLVLAHHTNKPTKKHPCCCLNNQKLSHISNNNNSCNRSPDFNLDEKSNINNQLNNTGKLNNKNQISDNNRNIFDCFKRKTKTKCFNDLNEKLTNMYKMSMMNFNVRQLQTDESDSFTKIRSPYIPKTRPFSNNLKDYKNLTDYPNTVSYF